ncbi:flagella basal body P-ring formation protein FlgA [Rubrivivax gelatinosus]|uniref:flagellar basal body P-ring formation chaperone FlgA n=1 Tax=Rubrivivax gelatinosus TaxID=28068 RepID=UPI001908173B|nr:flagellar basal body P-ring formation chaperone FlgA [Rubrivivax gelatinosus]MBK1616480.1 flagella basal body P-ring formation protein FlgA [Rubrivivax gelatinosus]
MHVLRFANTVLIAACAAAAPAWAQPQAGAGRVAEAARALLLEQAANAGWREPQLELDVQPMTGSAAPRCSRPEVQALDTRSPARMRFELRCPGSAAAGQGFVVRARLSAEVLVAALALPAGRALAAGDVQAQRREITPGSEPLSDAEAVLGLVAQRSIAAGQVLSARLLAEPLLVRRGEAVEIHARREAVEVVVPGQALDAGRRGETIRVRNTATGKVIQARVAAAGRVEPADMLSSPP